MIIAGYCRSMSAYHQMDVTRTAYSDVRRKAGAAVDLVCRPLGSVDQCDPKSAVRVSGSRSPQLDKQQSIFSTKDSPARSNAYVTMSVAQMLVSDTLCSGMVVLRRLYVDWKS